MPVVIDSKIRGRGGSFKNGCLVLEPNIPPKLKHAIAEHEFGHIWSHVAGNALMMLWLEKHGLFKEFLEWKGLLPGKFRLDSELRNIAFMEKGFEGFKKYFLGK